MGERVRKRRGKGGKEKERAVWKGREGERVGKWEVVCLFWGGRLRVEGGRAERWQGGRVAGRQDGRMEELETIKGER